MSRDFYLYLVVFSCTGALVILIIPPMFISTDPPSVLFIAASIIALVFHRTAFSAIVDELIVKTHLKNILEKVNKKVYSYISLTSLGLYFIVVTIALLTTVGAHYLVVVVVVSIILFYSSTASLTIYETLTSIRKTNDK